MGGPYGSTVRRDRLSSSPLGDSAVERRGEKLSSVRVANDPLAIAAAVAEAGPDPEVVVEATYGWYWVVDLLQANGARGHLANPQGLDWGQRRVKNDERDAIDLADMLRLGRLPEAWIAPPPTRELRELVRYRAKLDGSDTAWREPVIGMTPAARGAVD
jgi:Transposase